MPEILQRAHTGTRMQSALAWLAAALVVFLVLGHTVAAQRILLGLLLLGFLFDCARTRDCIIPLKLPLALWLGWCVNSLTWSVAPAVTADELLDEALYPLFLFVLLYALGRVPRYDGRILAAVLTAIALLGVLSLGGFQTLVTDEGRSGWLRYYPGVGQASTFAVFAIPVLFVALGRSALGWRIAAAAGLLVCLAIGAGSLNRAFWPAAIAAIFFCVAGMWPRLKARYLLLFAVLAVAISLGATTFVQSLRAVPPGAEPLASPSAVIESMLENDPRPEMWRTWSALALERPWTGIGFGQELPRNYFRARDPANPILADRFTGHHAHNLFLNTVLQTGLIGLALLLGLLGALTWRFLRQRRLHPVAAWAGVALVAAMLLKNATDDFMRDAVAMYFWALAGWLLAFVERPRTSVTQRVQPLSVVLIARNEAHRIGACIRAVQGLADEILVLDSGSSDGTPELCRSLGARVIETDWPGYGAQKNRALREARHDWVLSLDADERVTPALAASIRDALAAPYAAGFRFRRCNRFLGRNLRHGEGYPDWSLRLFDRRRARWSESPVHEKAEVDGLVANLDGDLLHDSAESLHAYVAKQNDYSTLAAEQALRAGKRATSLHLLLSPLVRFVRFYVLRLGFLDGRAGLVHILVGCYASFLKYAKMIEQRATGAVSAVRQEPYLPTKPDLPRTGDAPGSRPQP